MSESPSARLKAATAVLHQRVEDGVDVLRRIETVGGYVGLLRGLEAFYAALDPLLDPLLPSRRVARLRADLDLLEPSWEPLSRPVLRLEGNPLGWLYVAEGAALGGRIVARRLEARHGFDATHGAAFFGGDVEALGPRWREVRAMLDADGDVEGMIAGAVATFLAFEVCLTPEVALA